MANILNIDTSSSICSVALAQNREIVVGFESKQKMDHSTSLAPFVRKCLDFLKDRQEKLDAISVTNGPGSYTGLRIGLSLAKGLAFGLDIPIITLSTLEVMAVRAIFTYPNFQGDEMIVPMLDARRMEVYTAVYNSSLKLEFEETALVLDSESFEGLKNMKTVLFIGDGTEKFKDLYRGDNGIWLGNNTAHAKFMIALSEKYYRDNKFSDLAYTVPSYLKEYKAIQSKNKVIH